MDSKDQAELYMRLYETRAQKRDVTRSLEMKVNLAIWTAVAIAGHQLVGAEFYLNTVGNWVTFLAGSALLLLLHTRFWMIPVQRSEDADLAWMNDYESGIRELMANKPPTVRQPGWRPLVPMGWNWVIFEVGFTAAILVFWMMILAKTSR